MSSTYLSRSDGPSPSSSPLGRPAAPQQYATLASLPEEALDRVTRLAADLLDTPMALISLVAEDRQRIPSAVGFDRRNTELDASFCVQAFHSEAVTIIEDAAQDERTANHPHVIGDLGLRFYAGVPLTPPDGQCMGTLCVLDTEPRHLSEKAVAQLEDLAAMVVDELEFHRQKRELQRRERELRQNRRRFEAVFEDPGMLVGLLAPDGRLLDANPTALEYIDADREAVLGRPFWETPWFSEDTRPQVQEWIEQAADGEYVEYELDLPHLDASPRSLWGTVRPVTDGSGTVVSLVISARDVTEQKQIETKLREREERLRSITENVSDGIYRTARGEGVVYANQALARMFGFDDPEVFRESDPEMFYANPETRKELFELVEETESFRGVEATFRRKDGSTFPGLISGTSVHGDDGTIKYHDGVITDITDQKRAEEKLRKSQERWRKLIENQKDAIHISIRGTVRYINPAGVELVGADSQEEVIGRSMGDFLVSEEAKAAAAERMKRVQEGESVDPREYVIERFDGERRIVEVYGLPIEYEGERATQGIVHDVTEEKKAVRELKQSEERFRLLAEQTSDIITRHGADLTFQYVSPSVEPILGYAPEDLIDQNPVAFIHPDDHEQVEQAQSSILAEKDTRIEFRFLDAEGEPVWVESVGRLVSEDPKSPELVVSTRPIQERKEAEEELRKSRKRWQQLVESQQDGIHISVDGILQYVNPAGAKLLGAESPDDLVGRDIRTLLTSEAVRADMTERTKQLRRGEPTEPYEHEVKRLDGEIRVFETYSVPTEHEGQPAAQTVFRDVTERKRTQRQLRQAQKMETVGSLAGGIAHDFNNILHSVSAYVEMVEEDLSDGNANHTLLHRASQGLDRAGDLVEKLLTFSRQDQATQTQRMNVGEVVCESMDLVAPSLPESVTVRTEIGEECTVIGDSGQLHQVATNILTNAGQAMREQASAEEHVLDVDVRSIDVDEDLARRHLNLEPGRYVRLSISDTGPGMDEETRERIFEPFFTTKEVNEGTGLGLSVVLGIVQSHDGEIAVYTRPGEGTTFDVYLPHATEVAGSPDASSEADRTTESEGGHVLFVDDDEHIRELEAVRLRQIGYAVTTCECASEALQAFDDSPGAFDLVLTDFAMPGKNGLELARALRDRGYGGPVVLMSGFSAQVSPEAMQEANVSTFLRKPVGSEELKQTLEELCTRWGNEGHRSS